MSIQPEVRPIDVKVYPGGPEAQSSVNAVRSNVGVVLSERREARGKLTVVLPKPTGESPILTTVGVEGPIVQASGPNIPPSGAQVLSICTGVASSGPDILASTATIALCGRPIPRVTTTIVAGAARVESRVGDNESGSVAIDLRVVDEEGEDQ